jgi:hypothetical protein
MPYSNSESTAYLTAPIWFKHGLLRRQPLKRLGDRDWHTADSAIR